MPKSLGSRSATFPINVEIQNDTAKKQGFVLWHIASEYKMVIGHSPTIGTVGGHIFQVRFLFKLNHGVFSNGWDLFVAACNLQDCIKVVLRYYGDSFLTFDERDQPGDQMSRNHNMRRKIKEEDNKCETENIFGHITLTRYSSSKNHQSLPVSFVHACLNLKMKHVLLELDGGHQWKVGLYNPESRPKEAKLTSGWKDFCSELHLKALNLY